jgi:hypothetical protein
LTLHNAERNPLVFQRRQVSVREKERVVSQLPPITRIQPLYRPVGYRRTVGGYMRYFIELRGEVREYRPLEMHGLAFLLEMYPDIGHWRMLFPRRGRMGVDTKEALAWFCRECQRAGLYQPSVDLSAAS